MIKPELHIKRNYRKHSKTWKLNNTVLNEQWVIEEIRENIQMFLDSNENENTTYQNL
jgi:hypothetical protein